MPSTFPHQGVTCIKSSAEDLEGIVAKQKLAPYVTRPPTWFKVLNPDYSQKRGRRELFDRFRERVAFSTATCVE